MKGILLIFCCALAACTQPQSTWVKPETITLGCNKYDLVELENSVLFNNVWNAGAAKDFAWKNCIEQKPNSLDPVYGWSWHWPLKGKHIYAYPQVKIGSSPWTPLPKKDSRFPVLIGDVSELIVSHELEIDADAEFNVSTSMWLTNTADIGKKTNSSIITAELMFWTYATENHMSPAGQHIGDIQEGKNTWSVWLDKNWGDVSGAHDNKWIYLTFRAETPRLQASFDASALLNDPLISELDLHKSYIADIELGTEIMHGDGLVWVNNFDVTLTSE